MEMQKNDINRQWKTAGLALSVVVITVLFSFFDTVNILVMTWWDKPEFNHCLLILPIIGYLVFERREIFHKISPEPTFLGFLPILVGGMLWMLGDLVDANVVQQFGLIIILQGCVVTILGKRVTLALIFPLFYMIFLVPFGDFLIPMLQDFTTVFVITILNIFNIPVFVEGVYLSIPAGDFHVAESCAGLRFLIATVALGTLMANVAYKSWKRQAIVVVLSFVVPVIANGFRASGIILIAHWSDMKYATGADHITFGWIFFAIVLLIFISISMTFTNRKINDGYIDFTKKFWTNHNVVNSRKFITFSILTIVVVGFAPLYVSFIEQRYESYENNKLSLSAHVKAVDVYEISNWVPQFRGASQSFLLRHNVDNNPPIDIFSAYYKYQTQDSELIQFGNVVTPPDVWGQINKRRLETNISGTNNTVVEVIIQAGNQKRLVWYWYWIDGEIITNDYKAKIFDAKAKLLGGRLDSAVMALSVTINNDDIEERRQQLAKFASSLPTFDNMVSDNN